MIMSRNAIFFMVVLVAAVLSEPHKERMSDTLFRAESTTFGADSLRQLDKIVVTAYRRKKSAPTVNRPTDEFTADDIAMTAGAADDISRYIATLPAAVASLGENFDNSLYVRGGRPSEVLFLVDGIEMENINHFSKATGSGGPVGFINSNYVRNVEFFAGDDPSEFPCRLSSIVSVDMKRGSLTDRKTTVGCRLTGGMLSTEGPVGSNASYLFSARYIDFGTLKFVVNDRGVPRLGDLLAKGFYLLNETDELSVTGVFSRNTYSLHYPIVEQDDVTGTPYTNENGELQLIYQGGAGITWKSEKTRISHRVTLSASFRDGSDSDSLFGYSDSFFTQRYSANPYREDADARYRVTLQTVTELSLGRIWRLSFGGRAHNERYSFYTVNMHSYRGDYTYCMDGNPVLITRNEYPFKREMTFNESEAGVFCSIDNRNARLGLSTGARSDYFRMLHSFTVSPHLQMSFSFLKDGLLKLSTSLKHQFPVEMPSLLFYALSWQKDMNDREARQSLHSLFDEIRPLRCGQVALGVEKGAGGMVDVKAALFGKWYDREYHFITPRQQQVFYFDAGGNLVLYPQDGKRKAYGIEGGVENRIPEWLHVCCSASLFTVKNLYRDGKWYDDWANVRYSFSGMAGATFAQSHRISFAFDVKGGRPYCPENVVSDCLGRKSTEYTSGDYYSKRLDRIVSINIRYGLFRTIGIFDTEFYLDILNLLDAQPTLDYRFNGESFSKVKPFGITPIAGVTLAW